MKKSSLCIKMPFRERKQEQKCVVPFFIANLVISCDVYAGNSYWFFRICSRNLFIVQTKTQPQMQNSLEYFILGYRLCNRFPFSSSRSFACSASDFIFQHRVVHCSAWLHLWESKHCGPCMCIMYYLGVRTLRLINAFEKCQRFLSGDKLVASETSSLLCWSCCWEFSVISYVESFKPSKIRTSRCRALKLFSHKATIFRGILLNFVQFNRNHLFVVAPTKFQWNAKFNRITCFCIEMWFGSLMLQTGCR